MFTRPDDLADADVAAALHRGWSISADELTYAPLGFGSHHWIAVAGGARWFVTVDDLEAKRRGGHDTRQDAFARLAAALSAARALYEQGLAFVVAPIPTTSSMTTVASNKLLLPIGDRYAAALYRYIDGQSHDWGQYETSSQRTAVVDRLVVVHASSASGFEPAVDDFTIPRRSDLETALVEPEQPWGPGPYADRARDLLQTHGEAVQGALVGYDNLAARVVEQFDRFVITHGEPHRANTIITTSGVHLIDWDTALVAPPERDLWMLIDEDPAIADYYTKRTGSEVDLTSLRLYQLWWDLCEVSLFVDDFRRPHTDSEDARTAWAGLQRHLDPNRWIDVVNSDGR